MKGYKDYPADSAASESSYRGKRGWRSWVWKSQDKRKRMANKKVSRLLFVLVWCVTWYYSVLHGDEDIKKKQYEPCTKQAQCKTFILFVTKGLTVQRQSPWSPWKERGPSLGQIRWKRCVMLRCFFVAKWNNIWRKGLNGLEGLEMKHFETCQREGKFLHQPPENEESKADPADPVDSVVRSSFTRWLRRQLYQKHNVIYIWIMR